MICASTTGCRTKTIQPIPISSHFDHLSAVSMELPWPLYCNRIYILDFGTKWNRITYLS
jgi:hypothetical protein